MPEKVHVQSGQEARYWKAFMLWRLGEFNAELRDSEPHPAHRTYDLTPARATQIRVEVSAALAGAGLAAMSRSSRYDEAS
jgi:hypothetical protein